MATSLWVCYDKVWDAQRNRKAQCKGCQVLVSPQEKSMLSHARWCSSLQAKGLCPPESVIVVDDDEPVRKKKLLRLEPVVTGVDLQAKIDLAIGRYFVATNNAFAAVENPYFLQVHNLPVFFLFHHIFHS